MKTVVFGGIDSFNRPVFVNINNPKDIYGCTDILFGYGSTEADVLAKVSETDLSYYANHLGCEPMGTPAGDITIRRSEPVAPTVCKPSRLPWTLEERLHVFAIIDADGNEFEHINKFPLYYTGSGSVTLRNQTPESMKGNAELIVRACNNHDELVTALDRVYWLLYNHNRKVVFANEETFMRELEVEVLSALVKEKATP